MPDSALTAILAGSSGTLLGTATNVFVIVSVLVAIAALGWAFRTRRNVVEIQNYKGLAESYEQLHAADKAKTESQQARIEELEHETQALRAKVDTLTEILTGKTVVDELARAVDRLEAVTSKIEDLTRRGAP